MPLSHPNIDESVVEAFLVRLSKNVPAARESIAPFREVRLLAVTKGQPVEALVAAHRVGLRCFGENYAQELAAKAALLTELGLHDVEWHFIGQLQTNKVRLIAGEVTLWQSVDRLRVASEIARRAPGARVLIQANLSNTERKAGAALHDVPALVEAATELGLTVEGLMGVGTHRDETATAAAFGELRRLCDQLSLATCSMGMTADLLPAVRNGSTMVRVGSGIFGPRT